MENKFELFGKNVLTEEILKKYLSASSFKKYKKIVKNKLPLDEVTAKEIAAIMKNWAIENGATHYSHWFQPLNGNTAEKQTSFLNISLENELILEFPVDALITGEADASSFPNGGLRTVFEARGCTSWDYTAPAFLKEDSTGKVLCIPTVFNSVKGEALDKRTPLLNSCKALEDSVKRILKLFGENDSQEIISTIGAEQEYFLIKREFYEKRKDLKLTGRTLFGREVNKTMNKHYLRTISEATGTFMNKVEEELWKLGVPAKTKHNEVALHQYELVPNHENMYLASNHDHLIMEILKREAKKLGLTCILHEKPFAGMNGSGKHNNWSIVTEERENLFSGGDTPEQNARFVTMLVALMVAVNKHANLIRATIATASNDLRLSGYEAPTTIISMYLGEEITEILEELTKDNTTIKLGKTNIKFTEKFITDRNRTSPFAFVGNRFEFRMPGSASSIAVCNTVLNTIMAESLDAIFEELENSNDFYSDLQKTLAKLIKENKQIIYNGNNYSDDWKKKAQELELSNIKYAWQAFNAFIDKQSVELFEKYNIYSEKELNSRYNIKLSKYISAISLEAEVLIDMINQDIIPQAIKYSNYLNQSIEIANKNSLIEPNLEINILKNIRENLNIINTKVLELKKALEEQETLLDITQKARFAQEVIREKTFLLRENIDNLETLISKEYWPFPTYEEILLEVKK